MEKNSLELVPDPTPEDEKRRAKTLSLQGKTECTACHHIFPSATMVVMRAEFRTYVDRKSLKVRTVGKLCLSCLEKEPAWNQPKNYM